MQAVKSGNPINNFQVYRILNEYYMPVFIGAEIPSFQKDRILFDYLKILKIT
jgi:hypothetical protein